VNPDACLAVIPVGTGGDFRRTIGLEPDPLAALSLLTGDSSRGCDVGHATYEDNDGRPASRFFLNVTSFGLGGLVDRYVNSSTHSLPGSLNYFVATLRAFAVYTNVRVRAVVDGAQECVERSVIVAVANGRFFGGGMEVAPHARLDDGLLDLMILGDLGLPDFMFRAHKLYGGRLLDVPLIQHHHVRKVVLEAVEGEEMLMDMDGEQLGRLPATLRVFPGALRIKS
jgi:diacylglycerol kinase family enzyme